MDEERIKKILMAVDKLGKAKEDPTIFKKVLHDLIDADVYNPLEFLEILVGKKINQ